MLTIALRSAAHRPMSLVAAVLVAFVGTTLLVSMASILGTGLSPGTAPDDVAFLVQFPIILGSWVLAIVLFAMVSTIGVTLAGRTSEITGLRLIGATPAQVGRLVALETAAMSVVAVLPGLPVGLVLGRGLVERLQLIGMVDAQTAFAPGWPWPLGAALVLVVTGAVGGWLGSRRLVGQDPIQAVAASRARGGARLRRIAAGLITVLGLGSALTVLALDPTSIATTAATGPACVLVSVGAALLAPELIAVANRVLALLPRQAAAGSGQLARINLVMAPERVRPVVTFLTLFVGVSAGTLSMQGIENGVTSSADSAAITMASINYLVVGLIAAFMAIALVNNVLAMLGNRRGEFATLSLIGATRRQTVQMVGTEVAVAAATSAVVGWVVAVVTVIPFAIIKTGSALPALVPWPHLVTVIPGVALTMIVAAVASRRVVATA